MKKKGHGIILFLIFISGILILLYPTISDYYNSKVQSQAIIDYDKVVDNIDYETYLNDAIYYNEKLSKLDYPLVQYKDIPNYSKLLNINNNGMIGYISIEKIKVELPIYHGTDKAILNVAVGHLEGSSLPVGGLGTHSILSAHRGLPTAKLFTNLNKLEIGDTFQIKVLNQTLTYQVDNIVIVEPEDISNLAIEDDKDYVTLLTCTPYGINTHRLLVRGVRIENKEKTNILLVENDAYKIDKLIVTLVIALPILLILTMYIIFKPLNKNKEEKI